MSLFQHKVYLLSLFDQIPGMGDLQRFHADPNYEEVKARLDELRLEMRAEIDKLDPFPNMKQEDDGADTLAEADA